MRQLTDFRRQCGGCRRWYNFTAEWDFTPAEPAETGPGARYPGCDADAEIEEITVKMSDGGRRTVWLWGNEAARGWDGIDCHCGERVRIPLPELEKELIKSMESEPDYGM